MVEKRLWKYPQEKVPKVESSGCQNKFLLAHCTKGVSPTPLSPPFLQQEQESFGVGILSCSVVRENQSEVEDVAPGKKNQICTASLFFCH